MPASDPSTPRGESANGASCDQETLSAARERLLQSEAELWGDRLHTRAIKLREGEISIEEFGEEIEECRAALTLLSQLLPEGTGEE